ncbi:MAG TPA: hypothetical protein VF719_06645 [Abditibacteriaceae bacterium]
MEARIKRNIFILIGVTVLLLIGMVLGWYFVLISPQKTAIEETQKKYDARLVVAKSMEENLNKQRKAEDRKRYVEGQLAFFRNRYRSFYFGEMGDPAAETPIQKANRINAWSRFLDEYFSNYGENLRTTLVNAANLADDRRDGQRFVLNTAVKVDAPPKAPEDLVVPANGFLKPTSATNAGVLNVTVTGSFAEIKSFLNTINRSPILFVIGNIELEGSSPRITATFPITPYLLANGKVNLQVPAAVPAGEGAPGEGSPDGSNQPRPTPPAP